MEIPLTFIAVIILLYSSSFLLATKEKNYYALWVIILASILSGCYSSGHFFLHDWDEQFHALVAKNMMGDFFKPTLYKHALLEYDYREWSGNHIWVHKQPIPLWLMAISMSIFGVSEITLRLPSILLIASAIFPLYEIARIYVGKKYAIFAAALFSINGLVLELASGKAPTDHYDAVFAGLITWGIFTVFRYYQVTKKYWLVLGGVFMGLAILTKWLPALIIYAIFFALIFNNTKIKKIIFGKRFFIDSLFLLVPAVLVSLPWQIYIHYSFPNEAKWESMYNIIHITTDLGGFNHPWYFYIHQIGINYGELLYIPLTWYFFKSIKSIIKRNSFTLSNKTLALILWICIPLIVFTISKTKMQGYILFVSPALFIIYSIFIKEFWGKKWSYNALIVLMIALPIRYYFERLDPFSDQYFNEPGWQARLKKSNPLQQKGTVLFNFPFPIKGMFYSKATVYSIYPESSTLDSLVSEGYNVFIAVKKTNTNTYDFSNQNPNVEYFYY